MFLLSLGPSELFSALSRVVMYENEGMMDEEMGFGVNGRTGGRLVILKTRYKYTPSNVYRLEHPDLTAYFSPHWNCAIAVRMLYGHWLLHGVYH